MTEFVNILFYAFAFGPFILYLCISKGSAQAFPFFSYLFPQKPPNPKGDFLSHL